MLSTPNQNALRGSNATNNNCLGCHYNGGTRNQGANAEIASNIVASGFTAYYDRIGFWPDSQNGSTSGFGFFHDGGASLERAARVDTNDGNDAFLAEILTLEGPSSGLTGDERRKIAHAGVGQQVTINGNPSSGQTNRLNQLLSIAESSPYAELVAKAAIGETTRGYVYLGNNNFQTDRQNEQATLAQLLAFAAADDPVTFTLVAEGTQQRIGIDRDLNGILDGDEVTELTLFNPGNQSNFEGASVTLAINATDPEGDILSYSASGLPPGISINSATGQLSGSLGSASVGNYTVTVTVTDGTDSESTTFQWEVISSDRVVQLAPLNQGIACNDTNSGSGYILYSEESVHSRFSANPPWNSSATSRNADHLICVQPLNGEWRYDNNDGFFSFTPVATDILVAEVDFGADSVTLLAGQDETIDGIQAGYASGDLSFVANQWDGGANNGEFQPFGTTIIRVFEGPVTQLGDVTCDDMVDAVDALAILQLTVGMRSDGGACPLADTATTLNASVGDVDGSGSADSVDALFILQCTVGMNNSFCLAE